MLAGVKEAVEDAEKRILHERRRSPCIETNGKQFHPRVLCGSGEKRFIAECAVVGTDCACAMVEAEDDVRTGIGNHRICDDYIVLSSQHNIYLSEIDK